MMSYLKSGVEMMFASFKLDANKNKCCAFCKHWYDPTNQYIKPQDAKNGIWKFETTAKCLCLKWNLQKGAGMRCEKFENKLG